MIRTTDAGQDSLAQEVEKEYRTSIPLYRVEMDARESIWQLSHAIFQEDKEQVDGTGRESFDESVKYALD